MMSILQLQNITKNFGGLIALKDVSFDVKEGEILGIIGPNGAGKTTLFNVISGTYKPSNGKVIFKGGDITDLRLHEIAAKGIVKTFQASRLFKSASVLDNVRLGSHLTAKNTFFGTLFRTRSYRETEGIILRNSLEIIDSFGLEQFKDDLALNLSHGYQKILGLCIALATHPTIVLVDEPVAGMNVADKEKMMKQISNIRNQGITILMVEHDMKAVMNNCDRIIVLNFGKKIAEEKPFEIAQNKEVIEAYLGVGSHATRGEKALG